MQTNILYIEDNPENRLLVRRTLEASGYALAEAVDGPSGLKAAQESRPDLILLDISLPEMDGYDLARRFAAFDHLRDVPVLAVTANVMKGDKELALEAGCDGYIPKPIDIDQLPRQVEDALRATLRRRGERGPMSKPLPGAADGVEGAGIGETEPAGGTQRRSMEAVSGERADGSTFPEDARTRPSDPPRDGTDSRERASDAASAQMIWVEPPPVSSPAASSEDRNRQSWDVGVPVHSDVEDSGQSAPPMAEVPDHRLRRPDVDKASGATEIGESVFELTEALEASVIDEMESLAEELGAATVFLAQGAHVLAEVSASGDCRLEELAALAAQGLQVSHSAACLLGCDGGCREQITDSGTVLLHAVAVDGDLVLVAAMPASVPLGAARLWVRRAARKVDRMVAREG